MAYYWTKNRRTEEMGLSLLDLIQEGNIGLLHAIRSCKYDPAAGTYENWAHYVRGTAKYAIQNAISKSSQTNLISLTMHRKQQVRDYNRARREFLDTHEKEPTTEDMAEALGVGIAVAKDVEAAMQIYNAHTKSLDAPLSPNSDDPNPTPLSDVIGDDRVSPDVMIQAITQKWVTTRVHDMLKDVLHPTEQFVLRLSFGFENEDVLEDHQIARTMGISQKEVRILREMSLQRLRAYPDVLKWFQTLKQ